MGLAISRHDHGGVPVVSLAGDADLASLPRLRDALVRAVDERPGTTVVVDLDGVAALDDAALGGLVAGLGRARAHGGDLALVCTAPNLLDLLTRCRLHRVFTIHATRAGAIGATMAPD